MQKENARHRRFYRFATIMLLVSIFAPLQFVSSAPSDTGRVTFTCDDIIQGNTTQITDGNCAILALGTHVMSTTFEITFSVENAPLDMLIMGEGAKLSYQNSQLYRPYLEVDPTFENISNSSSETIFVLIFVLKKLLNCDISEATASLLGNCRQIKLGLLEAKAFRY